MNQNRNLIQMLAPVLAPAMLLPLQGGAGRVPREVDVDESIVQPAGPIGVDTDVAMQSVGAKCDSAGKYFAPGLNQRKEGWSK